MAGQRKRELPALAGTGPPPCGAPLRRNPANDRESGTSPASRTSLRGQPCGGIFVVTRAGMVGTMADKVWTAQELERMTPAEQAAVFEASVVTDLGNVPPEFLERVRNRARERIADEESRRR